MKRFILESNYFSKEDKNHLLKEYEKMEVEISTSPIHLVHEILEKAPQFWMQANKNGVASAVGSKLEPMIEHIFGWFKEDEDGWDFRALVNATMGNINLKKDDKIELKGFNTFTTGNTLSLDCYMGDFKIRFALIPQHRIEKQSHSLNFNPGLKHNHSEPIFSKMTLLFEEFEIEDFNNTFKKLLQ